MRKNKIKILQQIRLRAARKRQIRSKRKKKYKCNKSTFTRNNRKKSIKSIYIKHNKPIKEQKKTCLRHFLPIALRYLLETENSPFNLKNLYGKDYKSNGYILIPQRFSITDNHTESFETLKKIIYSLFIEDTNFVTLDYKQCECTELSTQVLLDIILSNFVKFKKICKRSNRHAQNIFPHFGGININNKELKELMWSVGSPATLGIEIREYKNVVKYPLCVHSIDKSTSDKLRMEQKELDTTELVDYVIMCLNKMNKRLTSRKRDDLCTVIGEILINAEEHSTTNRRYSIGFFREDNRGNDHFGLFRLVILNFGKTIYEKFKSDDCPNKDIVNKMKELSNKYTQKSLFHKNKFEEENLWTLYALQEGVTSISTDCYKRGNGSIRFIDSFFNIKGNPSKDNISRMTLLSGNTQIRFDGKYNIVEKKINNETFKIMSFNNTGNIEDMPDSESVFHVSNYFPGTMLSVKLLLNDDDIQELI